MDPQKRRVAIPCNHRLEYESMDPEDRELYYSLGLHYDKPSMCDACFGESGDVYCCSSCGFSAHEDCIDFPDVINYPLHSRHPLKIVSTNTVDGTCHFCLAPPRRDRIYHCSICNLSLDIDCWLNPPPMTIYQPKSHDHTFTLMARKVSFNCNACGILDDRNPYVCLECGFMLHKDCIDLPRVININRHDHRVSHSYYLGLGDWECGVCRKMIDRTFGAFSCKRCPNYAVHSKCATREDVWDGKELVDEPEEEEEEEEPPFKVINDKEIIHFSHEHNLRLIGDDADYQKMRCDACISPINSDPFFKCVECDFFLHNVCASLPRKKRNILYNHKLALGFDYKAGKHFECSSCSNIFDGFRYYYDSDSGNSSLGQPFEVDVRCGSISEPFHHELHPHPLYRILEKGLFRGMTCGACGKESWYVLSCNVCEFALGMECATLPRKMKHICDNHVLSLHRGAGNSKGQLWCDICETKTDPSVWYYGCDECETTLHINCVLGDMYYLKPGNKYREGELVPNHGMTRPFCFVCKKRCMFPSFLKSTATSDSTVLYACSWKCAYGKYGKYGKYEVVWWNRK